MNASSILSVFNPEYPFECSCGECFATIEAARFCRKCRTYSLGGRCLYVTDLITGEIAWGRLPTLVEEKDYLDIMRETEEAMRLELERWNREDSEEAEPAAVEELEEWEIYEDITEELLGSDYPTNY